MKVEVSKAIEELKRQFGPSTIEVKEDGQGGARVVMHGIAISPRFQPASTWLGFHIPAQYPYADIYPVFIGGEVRRVDGVAFTAPVTPGHAFESRPAIQVSRRNSTAQNGLQTATAKVLKVLDFLARMP